MSSSTGKRLSKPSSGRLEVANATAKIVTRAALIGAISLLLGAIAGWFGGRMGAVEPTLTRWLRPGFIAGASLVPGEDNRR